MQDIPPGSAAVLTWRCIVKSENVIEETQQFNLSARLSFSDSKNFRQTLTVSPIAFTTVSSKEQDQISVELKLVKENISKYKEKLLPVAEKAGGKVLEKFFGILNQLIEQAEGFVKAGAIQNAKSWSKLLQLELELINEIPNQVKVDKEDK